LWMKSFYKQYIAGQPLSAAMRVAAETVRNSYASAYHWAAFEVFGAGD